MSDGKPKCCSGERGEEVFRFLGGQLVFDVARAKRLVADGRAAEEVEGEVVEYAVRNSVLIAGHLGHVDPARPGIMAHFQYATAEGETVKGHVLIDGNHRAARCLQLHRSFFAYFLSEEESQAILLPQELGG